MNQRVNLLLDGPVLTALSGVVFLLPLLFAWLGFYLLSQLLNRPYPRADWRTHWLGACVGWGISLVALVELTSAFHALNRSTMLIGWTLTASLLFLFNRRRQSRPGDALSIGRAVRGALDLFSRQNPEVHLMLGATLLLITSLGVIGVVTPTTTGDALTYHLPRVMHWIQNSSIAHFPTDNCRQNEFGPWSGFALTQLHLLFGADWLDNLVQWFAMIGSAIAASIIAEELYLLVHPIPDRAALSRLNAFAGLAVVSLPIALVESITTQTDHTASFWVVTFLAFAFKLQREPLNWFYALGSGAALGLAALTKATAYFYCAPWVVLLAAWVLFRVRPFASQRKLLLIYFASFAALNLPQMARNYSVIGSPLACKFIVALERNEMISIGGTFSNMVRNLALQTNSGFGFLTHFLNSLLAALHKLSGHDLQDPTISYHMGRFVFPDNLSIFDSYAPNFWHLLLVAISLLVALPRARRYRIPLLYLGMVLVSFILFCALLRWQLWHSRVHLGFFVLALPFVAVVLVPLVSRTGLLAMSGFLLAAALYVITHNGSRPILNRTFWELPREEKYLAIHGQTMTYPMTQLADDIALARAHNVALKFEFDDLEYPVWVMLRQRGVQGRIDHWFVQDDSRKIPSAPPSPEVLITTLKGNPPPLVTAKLPYRRDYSLLTTYWSESASRWGQLLRVDSLETSRAIERNQGVELTSLREQLVFRSVRPGRLTLKFLSTKSDSPQPLLIVSDNNERTELTLGRDAQAFEFSTAPPRTVLTLTSNGTNQPAPLSCRLAEWKWEIGASP